MEDLHLIAKIYETYSNAKEKFIDRNFQTNRFFMVLCLVLVFATYAANTLMGFDILCVVILSAFGLLVSTLWWINLDTYQFMIKVKYANVLEKMEDSFPAKPYQDEFAISQEIKKRKKLVVFADLQKYFALIMVVIFAFFFCRSLTMKITQPAFGGADVPVVEEIIE